MMYAMAVPANGRIGLLDHAFSEVMQGFASLVGNSTTSPRLASSRSPAHLALSLFLICAQMTLLYISENLPSFPAS
jgi:hypothetical protein